MTTGTGFKRGAANAQKAAQERSGAQFERLNYFKVEDGDSVIFRPVHDGDEWYHAKLHQYIPVREDLVWDSERGDKPTHMSAVCRKDPQLGLDGECYICDVLPKVQPNPKRKDGKYFPSTRYFVPFLIREEVRGTQEMIDAGEIPATVKGRDGKQVSTIDRVVGRQDVMVEVQETDAEGNAKGDPVKKPKVVLCNLGYDNFFCHLQGFYEVPNEDDEYTVLDRDFRAARAGSNTDTKYRITDYKPRNNDIDLRDPETRKIYDTLDIEKIILDMASEERYARWFDHRVEQQTEDEEKKTAKSSTKKAAPKAQQAKVAEVEPDDGDDGDDEGDSETLADMKARMARKHGRAAATTGGDED